MYIFCFISAEAKLDILQYFEEVIEGGSPSVKAHVDEYLKVRNMQHLMWTHIKTFVWWVTQQRNLQKKKKASPFVCPLLIICPPWNCISIQALIWRQWHDLEIGPCKSLCRPFSPSQGEYNLIHSSWLSFGRLKAKIIIYNYLLYRTYWNGFFLFEVFIGTLRV